MWGCFVFFLWWLALVFPPLSQVTSTRGPWRWTTGPWASESASGRWCGTSAPSTGSPQTPSEHAWCPTSPTARASWTPFTSSRRRHPSCPSLLGLGLPSLRSPPPPRPPPRPPSQAGAGSWPCWGATRRLPPSASPRSAAAARPRRRSSTGFLPSRRRRRSALPDPPSRPLTAPPGPLLSASCPLPPLPPPLPPRPPLTRAKSLSGPSHLWGLLRLSAGESAPGQPSRSRAGGLKSGLSEGPTLVFEPADWTRCGGGPQLPRAPRSKCNRIIEKLVILSALTDSKKPY